jgi:pSer/pThr/pTyr-binding forkhead associated (FHA) protein
VAVITADPDYYERHRVDEVPFPVAVPPRTIQLADGPVSIGRRSRSRGTNPAIDLSGPPEDPAVSHTHASLVTNDDGSWALVDHGSTNGTYLDDDPDPVPANTPLPLTPGSRIHVGAWTCITLQPRQG